MIFVVFTDGQLEYCTVWHGVSSDGHHVTGRQYNLIYTWHVVSNVKYWLFVLPWRESLAAVRSLAIRFRIAEHVLQCIHATVALPNRTKCWAREEHSFGLRFSSGTWTSKDRPTAIY